ncbi:MAG: 50S ribosomal protein L4 [Candidatus Coatesbacteria bacterium RBG_13_66_14]|uniref:Large ribosomal subunit protein uL4 n=1 Tax=Candidatus Coatesbacteria bacterium RBG_13_66_14 TaxID=1817816 RepID=A0A1F5F3G0_9BACT|nr:ribosomal protein L4 [uncultured bacterium]OGD74106.1 MAG: 50S ribosomal protein L4 [Candidatus Coatesbacteria bacterium RBG_13_66_14]
MVTVDVLNREGSKVGELELPVDALDEVTVTISNVVRAYMANQRRGTAATKTRGMVTGGGRKPWRQKGTGRARHGSRRSPLWVGGGIIFGPQPRDYTQRTPTKMKRRALIEALGYRLGSLKVVDELTLAENKTREVASILAKLEAASKPLFVTAEADRGLWLASRNIPGCRTARVDDLNAYLVMWHGGVVFTKAAALRLAENIKGWVR